MRRSAGTSALRSAMPRWISTAQRTASTTLTNSTSIPSPVVLTMRPAVLGDLGIDQFLAVRLELAQRAFFVSAHQPAVAGDVAGQDRSQPSIDALLGH